jgi:hypothetical protein
MDGSYCKVLSFRDFLTTHLFSLKLSKVVQDTILKPMKEVHVLQVPPPAYFQIFLSVA